MWPRCPRRGAKYRPELALPTALPGPASSAVPVTPTDRLPTAVGGLGRDAQLLRYLHSAIGIGELACLLYLWVCAITRRRDHPLQIAEGVLFSEGLALLVAKECPLGAVQRRAGDDVPMFELWFGPRIAPFAVPAFTSLAVLGWIVASLRRPDCPARQSYEWSEHFDRAMRCQWWAAYREVQQHVQQSPTTTQQ